MNQIHEPKDIPDLPAAIEEFLQDRREFGYTPSTIKDYEWALGRLAQRCPGLPVSHEDIAAAVEWPEWAERRHGIPSPFRPVV